MVEKTELLSQLRIDRGGTDAEPSRRGLWVGLAVVALAIVAGAWLWLGRAQPLAVTVAAAAPMATAGGSASVLDATGYITARRIATVSAKVTGKVREVMIEEGQRVEEGEVLATLDDAEAQAELSLREAQLASARAQLDEIRTNAANARREYERQQSLDARKLTSASALDGARTLVEALDGRLRAQEREVDVASESVDSAQVQLDNTIVRAPFSGVITVKAAQPGEMISPISAGGGSIRTGIGTVVDMDSLEIQVDVNEAYINRVQPGQPVEAVLNAYPEWKIPARVIAIVPTADRSKATVKVRIALDERDARIVPDMGVRVAFLEERAAASAPPVAPGVLVPAAAIRKDGGTDVVYVVKDGKAQRRAVTLGGTVGDSRQVRGGVSAGERVIIEAPAELKDGAVVALKPGA
ncbi:MAG: efflux RND transporter periplasmic adaptor subunit [Xanthomonadales bacterium]|nr:efflux RND transporter periplasmic adaptor subunit [Xanthomonadales bacterium]MBP6693046.1 efflux RND transporter periplasmic adaptor subunit [Xanthomonadales bacterium]MBP8177503.1 efflux RND transporter periplasmic adaptor subunit [Xanthomonadales bacterium]